MPNEPQPNPSAESATGAPLAGSTHAGLAATAAAHLAGSGFTTQSLGRNTQEIDGQASCLLAWAHQQNVVLTDAYFVGLRKHQSATAEHEVFFRPFDNRVVKRTYPGTFGVTPKPKGQQHHATPLFYLRRLELMNQVFHSDIRMEGVALGASLIIGATGQHPCMVISQPWIKAAVPTHPHPTTIEIANFMKSLGFEEMKHSYFGWRHLHYGTVILDARPDNFIKSQAGVVPIDLVIADYDQSLQI